MMIERQKKQKHIHQKPIFDAHILTWFFSNMMHGSSSFDHGDNLKAIDDCISNMTHRVKLVFRKYSLYNVSLSYTRLSCLNEYLIWCKSKKSAIPKKKKILYDVHLALGPVTW